MKRISVFVCLGWMVLGHWKSSAQLPADQEEGANMTLDQFVARVQNENPELRFYEAEIEAAQGGRRQAGIYANPELSAGLGRKKVSGNGLSDEGLAWSVSVMQTFEYPGRMNLRKSIADANLRIAELGLNQFRAALKARASVVGFDLLAAQRKAEAATEVAERLRELSEVLVQRDPAGVAPLIEVSIVDAAVVAFRKRAIEASQRLQSALFEANLLRGQPLATPLRIGNDPIALPEPPSEEVLLSNAMRNNFELRMRQIELEQQGFAVELSRNGRWPDISVGPFVSQAEAGDRETVAGIGISLPLPLWNRNRGHVEMNQSREIQAETSLYLSRREVERSVLEHSLAYRLRLHELAEWGDGILDSFHEAAELGDRHYRLGALPIGTYMELQRDYLDAVEAIVDLQIEAIEARGKLEMQTGLPSSEWSLTEEAQ